MYKEENKNQHTRPGQSSPARTLLTGRRAATSSHTGINAPRLTGRTFSHGVCEGSRHPMSRWKPERRARGI